jgi:ligand-binding sensor domain-containing protein
MKRQDDQRIIKLLVTPLLSVLSAMALVMVRVPWTVAQESPGAWSQPVRLSTNTISAWFSDVAVDDYGRGYVIWNTSRLADGADYDLLMYSTWDGSAWSPPNDVIVAGLGGYTIRPALTVDHYGVLHLTHRRKTFIHHAYADAATAGLPQSWEIGQRLSGGGNGYYSDVAVDDRGRIHVVWNEQAPSIREKTLWFGTPDGIMRFDEHAGWDEMQGLAGRNRDIHALFEGSSGLQWVGTSNGVGRYDGATWQWFTPEDGLANTYVYAIIEDGNRVLWFGGDQGLTRYDPLLEEEEQQWETLNAIRGPVRALAMDTGGVLWIGTSGGLVQYDGWAWTTYTSSDGLAADTVTALAVDADNGVWVGTDSGLSRYDSVAWHTFTTADGLADNHITALAADRRGRLWVGTERGLGYYDAQDWASFIPADGLPDERITALAIDSANLIWVGTPGGVSSYDGTTWTSFSGGLITAIVQDRTPNAFCAGCADVFYRYSDDNGRTWSAPINLSHTVAGSVKPQVKIDQDGGVHVTWEEGEDWYVTEGYPIAAAHVYSPDGGDTWQDATLFTHPSGAPQQITVGVGRDGELIAVWRLPQEKDIYYQRSTDSGATWSTPQLIPGVGAKEWKPMSLESCHSATDSAGNVHLLIIGQILPVPAGHEEGKVPEHSGEDSVSIPPQGHSGEDWSVLHIVWNGTTWERPVPVFTSSDPPEWPRIAIGGGNKIFATWFTRDKAHIADSERGRYQVWAAFTLADAPALTPVPPPTATPIPEPTATPDGGATPTPTLPWAKATPLGSLDDLYTDYDDIGQLLLALLPIGTIVVLIAGLRARRIKR